MTHRCDALGRCVVLTLRPSTNVRGPMNKFASLLVIAALGASPSALMGQTQGDPQSRIEAAMQRAAAAGVPVEVIQSKVNEGRAKGVPLERIAQAAERRGAAAVRAQEAMSRAGQRPSASEIGVGADAIEAGVSEVVLARIAETAPAERRTVAIAVLTELVQQGMVPEEALQRVQTAMARGPEALANLPAQAAAARERRGPPAEMGEAGARPGQAGPPAGVPGAGGAGGARPGPRPGRPGGN
jgi:hypothetical protein